MQNQKPTRLLLLVSVATVGFGAMLAASQASAQPYPYYGPPDYVGAPPEELYVYGPRHHHERSSTTGAPIENVAVQRPVRFDDLDLRTPWGARELERRVSYTARVLCDRLDAMYPVAAPDNPPCYENAMGDAMGQAYAAIARARSAY
jgi:UrcA family protein